MITSQSLDLAELLVASEGFNYEAPECIKSLSSNCLTSFGVKATNSRDLKKELIANSTTNPDHGEGIETVSDLIANVVRGSLNDIKIIAGGLNTLLVNTVHKGYDYSFPNCSVESIIGMEFVPTNSPLFTSNLFPELDTLTKGLLDYSNPIQVDGLNGLTTGYLDYEEILELVANGVAGSEIKALLEDILPYKEGFDLKEFLTKNLNTSGESINFSSFTNLSVDYGCTFLAYLLVVKLSTLEEIPSFIKGISLANYRNLLSIVKDGLVVQLNAVRKAMTLESTTGIRIVTKEAVRVVNKEGIRTLEGNIRVYYSDALLKEALDKGYSLRGLITGYYFNVLARKGLEGSNLIKQDMELYNKEFKDYRREYLEQKRANSNKLLIPELNKALLTFITDNPPLRKRVEQQCAAKEFSINDWVVEAMGLEIETLSNSIFKHLTKEAKNLAEVGSWEWLHGLIINSSFIPAFLKAVGSNNAARILERTSVTLDVEDTEQLQRERLSKAVIGFITEAVSKGW